MQALSPRLYADLIGKPFAHGGRGPDAYDCVGLQMELQRRRGLNLPAYLSDPDELHRQIADGGVLSDAHRLASREPGCVVLMRSSGVAARHLGGMVDAYRMLHANEDTHTVIVENLDRSLWGRRVLGFYAPEPRP